MTTMSRLNTSMNDHAVVTNTLAVCILVAGVIVFVVNNRSNVLPKYSVLQPTLTTQSKTAQTPASKELATARPTSTTLTAANSLPLSLQNQPKDEVSQLQPAQDTNYNSKVAVNDVQPAANGVQLTGANLQDAATSLQ
jgi:hypothetical protein